MKVREIYHCPATPKTVKRTVTHSTEPSLLTRNNYITGLYISYTFYFDTYMDEVSRLEPRLASNSFCSID